MAKLPKVNKSVKAEEKAHVQSIEPTAMTAVVQSQPHVVSPAKVKKAKKRRVQANSINGSQNGQSLSQNSPPSVTVDLKVLREKLAEEDGFITQLLKSVPRSGADEEQPDLRTSLKRKADHLQSDEPDSQAANGVDESKRARNPEELRERLSEKLGQLKGKKLGFSELKDKKKIKRKLDRLEKKKLKKEKQKSKMKIAKLAQTTKSPEENQAAQAAPKPPKPVFNSEGRMVFSKFDFGETGAPAQAKPKKTPKDPKVLLGKLSKEKEKLRKLEKMGKADVVQQIVDKKAWENAIKRTEGEKVKDNPELLAKSAKRKENKKKQSKKKWAEREETVKKNQEQRQKKRQENLKKKKTEKKDKKVKRLEKKGKIIKGI